MEQEINKSETGKDIKSLYDEILRLSEQINSVKEIIAKEHHEVDSINTISKELVEEKEKTKTLEQYKKNIEELNKQIEELKKEKKDHSKWPFFSLLIVVLAFLAFGARCTFKLFSSVNPVEPYGFIELLTAGVIVLVVLAIVLMHFCNKSKDFFICN